MSTSTVAPLAGDLLEGDGPARRQAELTRHPQTGTKMPVQVDLPERNGPAGQLADSTQHPQTATDLTQNQQSNTKAPVQADRPEGNGPTRQPQQQLYTGTGGGNICIYELLKKYNIPEETMDLIQFEASFDCHCINCQGDMGDGVDKVVYTITNKQPYQSFKEMMEADSDSDPDDPDYDPAEHEHNNEPK